PEKDRIIYSSIPVFGSKLMLSDCPSDYPWVGGNNFALVLGSGDEKEIRRIFETLRKEGEVRMPLGKTFFSELFGMVKDKFGIIWQLSKTPV
ncbi:VOC family protein, partial [Treponema primitia]|uniref:VOC family protein n=1 Tax=Treponema primitia TaxID=88058 RepID=UPI00025550FD